jgi:hypothetical protein
MKSIPLIALLALAGCATCQRHPVVCGAVVAIAAGSIAASVQHHHDQELRRRIVDPGLHTHDCQTQSSGQVVCP